MEMSPWWVHAAQNVTELKFARCIVQFLLAKDNTLECVNYVISNYTLSIILSLIVLLYYFVPGLE